MSYSNGHFAYADSLDRNMIRMQVCMYGALAIKAFTGNRYLRAGSLANLLYFILV